MTYRAPVEDIMFALETAAGLSDLAEKGVVAADLLAKVWPKLAARNPVFPLVDSVHPLADAAKVHEYFDRGAHVGKIVLVP